MLGNKICKWFCLILVLFLVTACGSDTMKDVMKEVESTDLTNESIDDMKVGMSINDESFRIEEDNFEPHPDNEYYSTERNYDQYWNEEIIMSVDRETQEILQVGMMENNETSSSAMGIKIGSSIDEVIEAYGENYFTYEDNEQSIHIIGYVDHPNNLQLSFVHIDDKVIGINIGYAFDRINWEEQ
ncbi:hypothetical protein SH601_06490 [Gracilibacillus sp. S3-1-1]|uniref:Uncharacterized protein n=1 Tax=Gracilibacillus pellucidus TaxID=3095368 RepID=A0ACC6M405_9BACI|nr:hypothetical protein [Gracilibacillus sp. S3-1-1]MDX8045633.1 hypothetical protein [Gracilibacillus sp. S3-1-1]